MILGACEKRIIKVRGVCCSRFSGKQSVYEISRLGEFFQVLFLKVTQQ